MKSWKKEKKTVDVVCENCKKVFSKVKTEFKRSEKNGKKHFCSLECSFEYHKTKTSEKKCKNCGAILLKNKYNTFCSRNCSASYNNKGRNGEKRIFSEQGIKNIKDAIKLKYSIEDYYKNPNYCKECGCVLEYKKRKRKFCKIQCKRSFDKRNLNEYQKYYRESQFTFNISYFQNEFDFELIKRFGWYSAKNRGNNLGGVSRDHMFSIKDGYKNNIDPKIISHPANCKLMIHNDNSKKWTNSSISLDELKKRIIEWNLKYDEIMRQ